MKDLLVKGQSNTCARRIGYAWCPSVIL